ncbi:MAG: hypothetical protein IJN11_01120 [Oscillospiraceae bacterium]|nr:hypothetical protein [Oscillospiraceae bacterium]
MEETIIEIPQDESGSWQPPVLTHAETQKRGRTRKSERIADIFLIQYALCILFMTAVFTIRCVDPAWCDAMTEQFLSQMHSPDAAIAEQAAAIMEDAWK